ncbi:hypothetical protein [Streptomyces sp. NPDC046985]|uniref:hypothetical protein n=1 Tax=Streptomyces sp. NPDC046985 TaxID=3155377 RepID=UPI0033F545FA
MEDAGPAEPGGRALIGDGAQEVGGLAEQKCALALYVGGEVDEGLAGLGVDLLGGEVQRGRVVGVAASGSVTGAWIGEGSRESDFSTNSPFAVRCCRPALPFSC